MVAKGAATHSSPAEAFANLAACPCQRELILIGHGAPGELIVGGGDRFLPGKVLRGGKESEWQAAVRLLPPGATPLTLLSCDTGRGDDGTSFLQLLADTVGRPVRARTGFTYCIDGVIDFEPETEWKEAIPNDARSMREQLAARR